MRILLLSDIHANLEALEACLAFAPTHDIVVNLGDVVGYGASPNEAIERSRQLGNIFVRGNHDKAVCGLMDMEDFNPVASFAALWTRSQLDTERLEWLKALPHGPVLVEGMEDMQFVHGSPLDEDEYLVTPREAVAPIMASQQTLSFFGHTHLQGSFAYGPDDSVAALYPEYKSAGKAETCTFAIRAGFRYMINPGSVGQPRDGDWRAAFAVFDTETRVVTYCRVPYPLREAQERIIAANLPPRLATRLAAGR